MSLIQYVGQHEHIIVAHGASYMKFKKGEAKEVGEDVAKALMQRADFSAMQVVEIEEKVDSMKVMPPKKTRKKD